MATGIEAAGLALAIFPLLVSGLKFYSEGCNTIIEWRQYRKGVKELTRQLKMEQAFFENTCASLLGGMVSAKESTCLMEDPGGDLWKTPKIQKALQEYMPANLVQSFLETIAVLYEALGELQDMFRLTGFDKMAANKQIQHRNQHWKALLFTIQKDKYNAVMARIESLNIKLSQITGQRKQTIPDPKNTKAPPATTLYTTIRKYSMSLYDVFRDRFQPIGACDCHPSHDVNLQLEIRPPSDNNEEPNKPTNLRFTVLFSYNPTPETTNAISWFWRQMEFELIEEEKAPISFNVNSGPRGRALPPSPKGSTKSTGASIEDLCTSIQLGDREGSCLGVLVDQRKRIKHRIWPVKTTYTAEAISLQDVFLKHHTSLTDRLRLAVKLAYAVMQLHDTDWLNERWGKNDIYFPQTYDPRLGTKPVIDRPFVRRIFKPLGTPPAAPAGPLELNIIQYNKSIFSLGVMLVQLWYGIALDEPLSQGDSSYPATTGRIIQIIEGEDAIASYSLAVRRCIGGLDHKHADLGKEDFKAKVCLEVIRPLEESLESFCNLVG
ncbi:hypothetical protein EDC01DRAFT_616349 [Geopyxis carbonaria]|nr:hypothetical protein EDC01DRAFT_616349 [Geopyxis carbonaria]